jgi:hypothetical protein
MDVGRVAPLDLLNCVGSDLSAEGAEFVEKSMAERWCCVDVLVDARWLRHRL